MTNKLFQSPTFKNVLTLVSASVVAQVISFLFNIVLTRLYLPDQFGSLSVFLSIVSFITVVSAGKFDVAIVAAKEEGDVKKLFSLAFFVLFIVSAATALIAGIVYFFDLYHQPQVSKWLFYLAPSVVFLTGFQICWMWNVRIKNFKKISLIRITEPLANGLFSIVLIGFSATGLLLGTLIGQLLPFALILMIVFSQVSIRDLTFSLQELKATFKKYNVYPRINMSQGFLEIFQISSFSILLDTFFNATITGYFALGMRVLQIPVRLIVLPISHVFFAEASEQYRAGNSLFPLVKKTIARTALIALPVPVVLTFAGPYLFSFVFGSNWSTAGEYAQILALWTFFDLIKAPIIQIAPIIGKQHKVFYYSILSAVLFVLTFLIGGWYFKDIIITLWMVSVLQSLMNILMVVLLVNLSKK